MFNDFTNNKMLMNALNKGNEKAYTFLVDEYHHKLCIYAESLSKDRIKAEDIVQNVFLKIWEQRKKLKPGFSIKSYLYKSVYNEFIDQYRKNQSLLALEKKYIEALNALVEEDNETIERLFILVQKEIQNLPPKCKQVFLLSKQEGFTNIEISEHLNISIKTVEARMTRAFSLIREKAKGKLGNIFFFLFRFYRSKAIS